jgi:DNA-directed RNA polymerase subunit RPC12/RpoP
MTVTEKVAYLKGLVEGLDVDDSTKEGRIIKAIVEVLDDVALTVSDMEDGLSELSEQVDAIDEDLEDLEKDFYGDDDEDYDEDEDYYEVTCPKCGKTVKVDEDMLSDGEMECPYCGEKLEFDFSCDDEDCCCGDEDVESDDGEDEK